MTPFYSRLPNTAGVPVERTADLVGGVLTAAAVGGIAIHATATTATRMAGKKQLPQHPHGGQGTSSHTN
jgi:hypothetical protein